MGAMGGWGLERYRHEEILKVFFSETPGPILKKILKDCSLGDPFQKSLRNFDPSKNMAAVVG